MIASVTQSQSELTKALVKEGMSLEKAERWGEEVDPDLLELYSSSTLAFMIIKEEELSSSIHEIDEINWFSHFPVK